MFRHVLGTNAKRTGIGRLVQVRTLAAIKSLERLDFPLLPRKPSEHAPLDVRQVGHHELVPLRRNHAPADAVRERSVGIVVEHGNQIGLDGVNRLLHLRRLHCASRKVLELHETSGETPRTRSAHELSRPANAPVSACSTPKRTVLSDRSNGRRQAKRDEFAHGFRQVFIVESLLKRGFLKVRQRHTVHEQNVLKQFVALHGRLDKAPRGFLHFLVALGLHVVGALKRPGNELHVNLDSSIVYDLIAVPIRPHLRRGVPRIDALGHLSHGLYVKAAVIDETGPILGRIFPCPSLSRCRRLAELKHQTMAVLVFCLVLRKAEHFGQEAERTGQPHRVGKDHRVLPPFRIAERRTEFVLKNVAVEHRVVRDENRFRIVHSLAQILGHTNVQRQIPHLCGLIAHCVAKQRDLGARVFSVAVPAALFDVAL